MADIKNKIIKLVNSGNVKEARNKCLAACKKNPGDAEFWFLLSAICGQTEDFLASEKYCQKALQINPAVPSVYYNLAIAQRRQGKTQEAMKSLEKAISLQNDFTSAIYELGNISLELGDFSNAVERYNEVILKAPGAFEAYTALSNAQYQMGNLDSAIASAKQSLQINPEQAALLIQLGNLCNTKDLIDEAANYYSRAIDLGYKKDDVYINLGRITARKGKSKEAEKLYKTAIDINPLSIEAMSNLALLYESDNDINRAIEYIEKAAALDSADERIVFNHAKIFATARQFTKSEQLYKKVLDIKPDFYEAAVNLGNIYLLSGKVEKAQDLYSYACDNNSDYHDACSNMLLSFNYTAKFSQSEIRDKHLAWGEIIERSVTRIISDNKVDSRAVLPLKVGYVSPDFRNHSVAYFCECLLENSNSEQVINYCYSDVRNKDEVTERFEAATDEWRDIYSLDNTALARMIYDDGIDILVDLCGHISGNRLPMFAMKPAPYQVTYLGYPNTTGLNSIDYRIVDKNTDPEGAEEMMCESPLYLEPCFLCYSPYAESPSTLELPSLSKNYITFGSFNNLAKITKEVIETWSKMLLQIPDSRLCIKARQYDDDAIRNEYIQSFKDAGVDESRLELISYAPTTYDHLNLYNRIDIALDTFPYNGTTTTFEALWMGVPVICIDGDGHASRVGKSILKTLELDELIADDIEHYIQSACDLSNDSNRLIQLRKELRGVMNKSPLLDGEGFAAKFEASLIHIASEST